MSALMYVSAACPYSVKVELILSHSLPGNHIYADIERENTTVVFQQDGTLPCFSLKFSLFFALGFQIDG
jgi:hypothetical protein